MKDKDKHTPLPWHTWVHPLMSCEATDTSSGLKKIKSSIVNLHLINIRYWIFKD